MKQQTQTPDTTKQKELHTQGDKAGWIAEQMLSGKSLPELIVSYANERQALLNEIERLKKDGFDEAFNTCEQLRECHNLLDEIDYILNSDGYEPECNIRTKINQLIKKLKYQ